MAAINNCHHIFIHEILIVLYFSLMLKNIQINFQATFLDEILWIINPYHNVVYVCCIMLEDKEGDLHIYFFFFFCLDHNRIL